MTKANPTEPSVWFQNWIHKMFAAVGEPVDATWAVFFIPAAILIVWVLLDWWLIKDTPEAGFAPFDTADASSGQMHVEFTALGLLKKALTSSLMLLIACVEFTSGVFRNRIMNWYAIFAREIKQPGTEYFVDHWGLLVCVFGILGGFAGGFMSDNFFQSRRGPPAALLCGFIFLMTIAMSVFLFFSPAIIGWSEIFIVMAAIGVTSLMAGRPATDFGGRKATATCSGIVDGFAYLGSGQQSISLGFLTTWNWHGWPVFFDAFRIDGRGDSDLDLARIARRNTKI
jgi:MFS transporter, OPA family, glycerol-3-phosphate transporter